MINNIDFNKRKFRKVSGEEIDNIIPYLKQKISLGEDLRVIVGCDSKQKRRITLYSLVIVLYDEQLHKGAHIVNMKFRTPKEKVLFNRIMNESLYSMELAIWLDENLKDFYPVPKFEKNDYDGSIPTKRIEIHVDVNPEMGLKKKNKSNIAYSSIMGMLCSSGFRVKAKPLACAASCAADYLVKK